MTSAERDRILCKLNRYAWNDDDIVDISEIPNRCRIRLEVPAKHFDALIITTGIVYRDAPNVPEGKVKVVIIPDSYKKVFEIALDTPCIVDTMTLSQADL